MAKKSKLRKEQNTAASGKKPGKSKYHLKQNKPLPQDIQDLYDEPFSEQMKRKKSKGRVGYLRRPKDSFRGPRDGQPKRHQDLLPYERPEIRVGNRVVHNSDYYCREDVKYLATLIYLEGADVMTVGTDKLYLPKIDNQYAACPAYLSATKNSDRWKIERHVFSRQSNSLEFSDINEVVYEGTELSLRQIEDIMRNWSNLAYSQAPQSSRLNVVKGIDTGQAPGAMLIVTDDEWKKIAKDNLSILNDWPTQHDDPKPDLPEDQNPLDI